MESYDILVIMLSIALFISLIVWIATALLAMKVVKKLKATSDAAEEAVDNVREFTKKMRSVGDMSAFTSAISQVGKFIKEKRGK